MSRFPNRRKVLIYGATSAVAMCGVAGVGAVLACQWTRKDMAGVAQQLRVALADISEPERLAAWWWQTQRQSGRIGSLASGLQASVELQDVLPLSCDSTRRSQIRTLFQKEFRDGDFVLADRIVVARSECLVSAICLHEGMQLG